MEAEQNWFCDHCHTGNYTKFWKCRRCTYTRDPWCELDFDAKYYRYVEAEEEPVFKMEIIDMEKKLKHRVIAKNKYELRDFLDPEEKWKTSKFSFNYMENKNFEFVPTSCDKLFFNSIQENFDIVSEIELVINDKRNLQKVQQIRFCYYSEKQKNQIKEEKLKGLSEVWLNLCSEWYKDYHRLHEDGWVDQKTWMSFSPYERLIKRFNFSVTHLNVDPKTWRSLSDLEKKDFSNRRKRWLNENFRNFSNEDKKNLKFWNNRVRYKGKIFKVKGRNSLDGSNDKVAKALTEVEKPVNPLKLKGDLEGSAKIDENLAKSFEFQYKADDENKMQKYDPLKVNVNQFLRSEARTYESSAFDQVNVNQPIKFGTKDKGFITCPNWKPPDIQREEGDDKEN